MAFGNGGFRTRAASLLRPSLRAPTQSLEEEPKSEPSPIPEPMNEKDPLDDLDKSLPRSSAEKTSDLEGNLAVAEDIDPNRIVRTIPGRFLLPSFVSLLTYIIAWVHTFDEDDEDAEPSSQLISHPPPDAQVAQHNSNPSSKSKHRAEPPRGRLHDLQREWAPPTPSAPVSEYASKWKAFANSSAYPAISADGGELVTEEWLIQNGADYSRPWGEGSENGDAENDGARLFKFQARRKKWWERLQRTILRSSLIPLVIRTNVWLYSLIALALGGSIWKGQGKGSSPIMAVIVDGIALLYILYITYDEYTGKPLGLRSARSKMRLVFLDLFFIVFDSANLSLAFEAVSDSNAECKKLEHEKNAANARSAQLVQDALTVGICHQQKALASVLLIALISWLLTFSISVFR